MSNPQKFKELLAKYGVTQHRLAAQCNVSDAQISKVVNSPASRWGSRGFVSKFAELLPKSLLELGIPADEFEPFLPKPKISTADFNRSPKAQNRYGRFQSAEEAQHPHPEMEVSAMDDHVLEFFELDSNPFIPSRITSERDVLQTNEHVRLVRRVMSAAENSELLTVIAEHGAGKSTAMRAVEPLLADKQILLCKFMASDVPKQESVIGYMVQAMYDAIGCPERRINQQTRLTKIKDRLHTTKRKLAVLIDDGHKIHRQSLLAIKRRYDALSYGYNQLCAFIILSQPHIYSDLALDEMAEFKGHIDRYEMAGLLSEEEIEKYVHRKLRRYAEIAHCEVTRWITPGSAQKIWELFAVPVPGLRFKDPQVSPRRLNEICISLFERAYNLGVPAINAQVVENYHSRPTRDLN